MYSQYMYQVNVTGIKVWGYTTLSWSEYQTTRHLNCCWSENSEILCCRLEKTGKTGKTVDAYQVAPPLCWLLWRSVYGNLQWSPCSSGRSPQIWENYKYHPARPCSACLTQSMLWTRPCSGHVALNKEICQIICGSISNKQKIVSVKNGMRTEHSHRINSELNIHTEPNIHAIQQTTHQNRNSGSTCNIWFSKVNIHTELH